MARELRCARQRAGMGGADNLGNLPGFKDGAKVKGLWSRLSCEIFGPGQRSQPR